MPIQITRNKAPIDQVNLNGDAEIRYDLYFPSCENGDKIEVAAGNGFQIALVREGEEPVFEQSLILYPVPMRNPPRIIAKIAVMSNGAANQGYISHKLIGKEESVSLKVYSREDSIPEDEPDGRKTRTLRFDKKTLSFKAEPNKTVDAFFLLTAENVENVQLSVIAPFSLSENGTTFSAQIAPNYVHSIQSKRIYVRYSPLAPEIHAAEIQINATDLKPESISLSGKCEINTPLPWAKIVKFMGAAVIFCVLGVVGYALVRELTPKPKIPSVKVRKEGIYQKAKAKNAEIHFACVGNSIDNMTPSLAKWTNSKEDRFSKKTIDENMSDTTLIRMFNNQELDVIFTTNKRISCLDTMASQLQWVMYKPPAKPEIWVGVPPGNNEGLFTAIKNN